MLRIAALRSFSKAPVVMLGALSGSSLPRSSASVFGRRPRLGQFRMMQHVVPDLFLREVKQAGKDKEEYHHLKTEPLARVERRFRRPHQEGRNVAAVLIDRRRSAVGIFNLAVTQRLRHTDGAAGEISVVLAAWR